jgi:hypothetical protein
MLVGGMVSAEPKVDRNSETDAVVEVVFRSMLQEAAPIGTEAICLAVRRMVAGKEEVGDPAEALLSRLQKDGPRVRRASECRRGRGQPATETATGAPAVVLDIGPVEWRADTEVRVGCGFTRGGGVIREWEYEVVRQGRAWVVRTAVLKRMT